MAADEKDNKMENKIEFKKEDSKSGIYLYLKKLVLFMMSLMDFNPYEIYVNRIDRYEFMLNSSKFGFLFEGVSRSDEKSWKHNRKLWSYILFLFQSYASTKFLLLMIIESITYKKSNHNFLDCLHRKQVFQTMFDQLENKTNYKDVQEFFYSYNNRYSQFELSAINLGIRMGNPFRAVSGMSIAIYMSAFATSTIFLLILPRYYRRGSIDATHLRLFLDKSIEIFRLDQDMGQKLRKIIETQRENRSLKLAEDDNFYCKSCEPSELERIIGQLQGQVESLRPPLYNHSFLRWYPLIILSIWLYIALTSYPPLFFFCGQLAKYLEACSHSRLSLMDFVTLCEIVFCCLLSFSVLVVKVVVVSVNAINQYKSAFDCIVDMRECLRSLRSWNSAAMKSDFRSQRLQSLATTELARRASTRSSIVSFTSLFLPNNSPASEEEFQLELKLVRTLLRLKQTEDDITKNNSFIRDCLNALLLTVGTACMSILLVGRLNVRDLYWIRLKLLGYSIALVNLYLFGTAFAYSKWNQIRRVGCQLVAELTIRAQKKEISVWCNFITNSWIRFVCSLADERIYLTLFGLFRLDLKNLVSLNLVILSVMSLMKSTD